MAGKRTKWLHAPTRREDFGAQKLKRKRPGNHEG